MTRTLPGYQQYIHHHHEIPGWFQAADIGMFHDVMESQIRERITGDMLEIGCYEGKSAIALAYGLRHGERLHVCDVFDTKPEGIPEEGMSDYVGLTERSFLDRYQLWHSTPPVVHTCSSTALPAEIAGRHFRLIHVDGSHAYTAVRKDIHTAVEHSAIDAVLIFDDYRTSHTPGVSAAVWEAVATGWLYPFALTEAKFYATTNRASYNLWVNAARQFFHPWEEHVIHGLPVLRSKGS